MYYISEPLGPLADQAAAPITTLQHKDKALTRDETNFPSDGMGLLCSYVNYVMTAKSASQSVSQSDK